MSGTDATAPVGDGSDRLFDNVGEDGAALGAQSSVFGGDDGDDAAGHGLQGHKAGGSAGESSFRALEEGVEGAAYRRGGGAALGPRADGDTDADPAAPGEAAPGSAASYGLFGEKAAPATDSLFGGSASGRADSLFATDGGDGAGGRDIAEALFSTDLSEDKGKKPAPTARPAAHRRSVFGARGEAGEEGDDAPEAEHETEGLYAAAILGGARQEDTGLFGDGEAQPAAPSLGQAADSAKELEVGGDDLIAAFEEGGDSGGRRAPASSGAEQDALGLFEGAGKGAGGGASALLAGLGEDDAGADDLFGDGGQEGEDLFSMVDPPAPASAAQDDGAADVEIAAYIQNQDSLESK